MIRCLAVLIALLVVPAPARAALISIDWLASGDNLLTRDDVGGLDWLDLTLTQGLSVDEVLSATTTGSLTEFRFATKSEVLQLWSAAGIPEPGPAATTANFIPVSSLFTYLGTTDTSFGYNGSVYNPVDVAHAFFAESAATQFISTLVAFPSGVADTAPDPAGLATVDNSFVFQGADAYPYMSSYLVRDVTPVPEPGTLSLLFIGGGAASVSRHRRRRRT